jgi:hypothetical protein
MSCGPVLYQGELTNTEDKCIKKFKPVFTSDLYEAKVDVIGKHISGLVLFKTMPDSSVRIVFTNEAGVKFFDFEFRQNHFHVYQIIHQLNKKPVIKTLQRDFEMILMPWVGSEKPSVYKNDNELHYVYNHEGEKDCVVTSPDCNTLQRLEKTSVRKKKVLVNLISRNNQAPDSIAIAHLTFNMKIGLKRLQR